VSPATELALMLDRSLILDLVGLDPEPWQRDVVRADDDDVMLLCHRQACKSTIIAALATAVAVLEPERLIVCCSASERQSKEIYDKVRKDYRALGQPHGVTKETADELQIGNGSRVVSVPDSPGTIRGYSGVNLVIIDEAAQVSDETYSAVRPMLTRSMGRMVAMSTPFARTGWFFREWHNAEAEWKKFKLKASENPFFEIKRPGYLAKERRRLTRQEYVREYECDFSEAEGAVFSARDIDSAFVTSEKPFFTMGAGF